MVEKIIFLLETGEDEMMDPVDYEQAMFYLNELKDNL